FLSSRRRHTRFSRDWSSDVCSSDLSAYAVLQARLRDLPDPPTPARTVTRPEHCGTCYEPTRHRDDDHGRPYPCPRCHPDPRRRAAGAETETRLRVTQAA